MRCNVSEPVKISFRWVAFQRNGIMRIFFLLSTTSCVYAARVHYRGRRDIYRADCARTSSYTSLLPYTDKHAVLRFRNTICRLVNKPSQNAIAVVKSNARCFVFFLLAFPRTKTKSKKRLPLPAPVEVHYIERVYLYSTTGGVVFTTGRDPDTNQSRQIPTRTTFGAPPPPPQVKHRRDARNVRDLWPP